MSLQIRFDKTNDCIDYDKEKNSFLHKNDCNYSDFGFNLNLRNKELQHLQTSNVNNNFPRINAVTEGPKEEIPENNYRNPDRIIENTSEENFTSFNIFPHSHGFSQPFGETKLMTKCEFEKINYDVYKNFSPSQIEKLQVSIRLPDYVSLRICGNNFEYFKNDETILKDYKKENKNHDSHYGEYIKEFGQEFVDTVRDYILNEMVDQKELENGKFVLKKEKYGKYDRTNYFYINVLEYWYYDKDTDTAEVYRTPFMKLENGDEIFLSEYMWSHNFRGSNDSLLLNNDYKFFIPTNWFGYYIYHSRKIPYPKNSKYSYKSLFITRDYIYWKMFDINKIKHKKIQEHYFESGIRTTLIKKYNKPKKLENRHICSRIQFNKVDTWLFLFEILLNSSNNLEYKLIKYIKFEEPKPTTDKYRLHPFINGNQNIKILRWDENNDNYELRTFDNMYNNDFNIKIVKDKITITNLHSNIPVVKKIIEEVEEKNYDESKYLIYYPGFNTIYENNRHLLLKFKLRLKIRPWWDSDETFSYSTIDIYALVNKEKNTYKWVNSSFKSYSVTSDYKKIYKNQAINDFSSMGAPNYYYSYIRYIKSKNIFIAKVLSSKNVEYPYDIENIYEYQQLAKKIFNTNKNFTSHIDIIIYYDLNKHSITNINNPKLWEGFLYGTTSLSYWTILDDLENEKLILKVRYVRMRENAGYHEHFRFLYLIYPKGVSVKNFYKKENRKNVIISYRERDRHDDDFEDIKSFRKIKNFGSGLFEELLAYNFEMSNHKYNTQIPINSLNENISFKDYPKNVYRFGNYYRLSLYFPNTTTKVVKNFRKFVFVLSNTFFYLNRINQLLVAFKNKKEQKILDRPFKMANFSNNVNYDSLKIHLIHLVSGSLNNGVYRLQMSILDNTSTHLWEFLYNDFTGDIGEEIKYLVIPKKEKILLDTFGNNYGTEKPVRLNVFYNPQTEIGTLHFARNLDMNSNSFRLSLRKYLNNNMKIQKVSSLNNKYKTYRICENGNIYFDYLVKVQIQENVKIVFYICLKLKNGEIVLRNCVRLYITKDPLTSIQESFPKILGPSVVLLSPQHFTLNGGKHVLYRSGNVPKVENLYNNNLSCSYYDVNNKLCWSGKGDIYNLNEKEILPAVSGSHKLFVPASLLGNQANHELKFHSMDPRLFNFVDETQKNRSKVQINEKGELRGINHNEIENEWKYYGMRTKNCITKGDDGKIYLGQERIQYPYGTDDMYQCLNSKVKTLNLEKRLPLPKQFANVKYYDFVNQKSECKENYYGEYCSLHCTNDLCFNGPENYYQRIWEICDKGNDPRYKDLCEDIHEDLDWVPEWVDDYFNVPMIMNEEKTNIKRKGINKMGNLETEFIKKEQDIRNKLSSLDVSFEREKQALDDRLNLIAEEEVSRRKLLDEENHELRKEIFEKYKKNKSNRLVQNEIKKFMTKLAEKSSSLDKQRIIKKNFKQKAKDLKKKITNIKLEISMI